MEYYLAMKKNNILPFLATWLDLEGVILSEVSQSENDEHRVMSLTGGTETTQQTSQQKRSGLTSELSGGASAGGKDGGAGQG